MAEPILEAHDLSRSFPMGTETVRALDGVSLRVEAGEMVAIMGPSGSGKSTLLHLLGLMDRPSSGSYRLTGRPTETFSRAQQARLRAETIGFVFQAFHLVEHRRVLDNVALPLVYQRTPRPERRTRATEGLTWVGLTHRLHASPRTLSGGERQRVAIARAIVHRPRLLLCDEPTGSLDSTNGALIIDLLRRAALDGLAVVVVTHDPVVAGQADRVIGLRDGRVEPLQSTGGPLPGSAPGSTPR